MKQHKGLPVARPIFGDEDYLSGIDIISFVSKPAIIEKGIKLSEDNIVKLSEELKQVLAPVLIPDTYILRKTKKGEFYYLTFTQDDIVRLRNKWMKTPKLNQFNYDHNEYGDIAPAYTIENWIQEDLVYDKSVKYGMSNPIGTWYILSQITDDEFWNTKVKNEGMYGFSIEAYLDIEFQNMEELKMENILMAVPGLMHPDCLCGVRDNVWEYNYYGDPTTESQSPCEICIEAKNFYESTGKIPDRSELKSVCECLKTEISIDPLYKYLKSK